MLLLSLLPMLGLLMSTSQPLLGWYALHLCQLLAVLHVYVLMSVHVGVCSCCTGGMVATSLAES